MQEQKPLEEQLSKQNLKENLIINSLNQITTKLITGYDKNTQSHKLTIENFHFRFYDDFRNQMENFCLSFFSHRECYEGINLIHIFDAVIHNIEKANTFMQREIVKREREMKKQLKIGETLKPQAALCDRCEHLIYGQKIEIEKNRILYGDFSDPYSLFSRDKMKFCKDLEPEKGEGQLEFLNNERLVEKHICTIKDRVNERTNEILCLISDFKVYEQKSKDNSSLLNSKQNHVFKKCDQVMEEMIGLLKQRFFMIFTKLKKEEALHEKIEFGIQVGSYSLKRQKELEKKVHLLQKQQQLISKKYEQSRKMIESLHRQKIKCITEVEHIKIQCQQISTKGQEKQSELEKEKINHKESKQIIKSLEIENQQVKNITKQLKSQIKVLIEQKSKAKSNMKKKKSSIRVMRKSALEAIEDSAFQQLKNQNQKKSNFQQKGEEEIMIPKSSSRQLKKIKLSNSRRPTLNGIGDSSAMMTSAQKLKGQQDDNDRDSDSQISDIPDIREINLRQTKQIKNEKKSSKERKYHDENGLPDFIDEKEQLNLNNDTKETTLNNIPADQKPHLKKISNIMMRRKSKQKVHHKKMSRIFTNIENVSPKPDIFKHSDSEHKGNFQNQVIQRLQRVSAPVMSEKRQKRQRSTIRPLLSQIASEEKKRFAQTIYGKTDFQVIKRTSKESKLELLQKRLNHTMENLKSSSQNFNSLNNSNSGFYLEANFDGKQLEAADIFSEEDVINLYLSLEGALEHEKHEKRISQPFLSFPNHIAVLNRILTLIAAINSKNRCNYEAIKGMLIFPYQSIISQQNYIFISKSGQSSGKIRKSLSKILFLHSGCDGEPKICCHLKKFIGKLESLNKIEEEEGK